MKLKKKQLSILKEKMMSERQRVLASFRSRSEEEFHLKGEDRPDEVDQATSDYERAQMLRFRNRDLFYVKKLDRALTKVEDGEFGTCDECGVDIKFERLLARPTAELCIACKDEAEREEQGNFVARKSKSLGEQVSLVPAR